MEIAFQVEIDPWCRKVLTKHWPAVPKYGDIKDVTELPYVDVLAGGFPCQPVSVAGEGLAQEDERWMWPEFERVIRMVRPRYVLVENVPGLLARSRGFDTVLGGLATLGLDAEWQVLSAATFGAPQLRERLWLVAYSGSQRCGSRWPRRPDCPTPRTVFPKRTFSAANRRAAAIQWAPEPILDRMVDGLPSGLDVHRGRGLGNSVVPQVVEYIGRRIVAHARMEIVS